VEADIRICRKEAAQEVVAEAGLLYNRLSLLKNSLPRSKDGMQSKYK
jgi:hypothetical protein